MAGRGGLGLLEAGHPGAQRQLQLRQTRAKAPDQREYDLTIDYRPAWLGAAFLQGLWLRVRGAILDQDGANQLGAQIRVILNWERDLL